MFVPELEVYPLLRSFSARYGQETQLKRDLVLKVLITYCTPHGKRNFTRSRYPL
jgi:hypothetical protein